MLKPIAAVMFVLLAATVPAYAHVAPSHSISFMAGFSHPFFGIDHIVAMVAVGLWAAAIGGRALWIVPASFCGAMTLGYFLSLGGLSLPYVEPVILASVVVLGLFIATMVKLPTAVVAVVVGLFAIFHGFAHGGEVGFAAALPFGFGFAIATTLLHAAGIGAGFFLGSGMVLDESRGRVLVRALGSITAAIGVALVFG
jgi:urease accessory protein